MKYWGMSAGFFKTNPELKMSGYILFHGIMRFYASVLTFDISLMKSPFKILKVFKSV